MNTKLTFFALLSLMLFISCKSDKEAWLDQGYYFYFDELDHYRIEIESEEIMDLAFDQKKTTHDSLLFSILMVGKTPTSVTDTGFLADLEGLGYVKSKVPDSDFAAINEIFREKEYTDVWYAMCMPEFRDILVFKEKSKTVGIAKLCFGCRYQDMVGTIADRDSFGMDDDYDKLYDILNVK
jgi:hypothetical protein